MNKQLNNAVRLGFAWLLALGSVSHPCKAQLILTGTDYSQSFDNLSAGLPAGWSVDTGLTATSSGTDVSNTFFLNVPATNTNWNNSTGRFKNVASATPYMFFAAATNASQAAQSDRALGIRQNASLDKHIGFVLKIANTTGFNNFSLSFNLQSLDSNASRLTTWMIDYGIGSDPASFIPVAATGIMTTGGNQFSKNTITADFGDALDNKQGPVYIRILSLMPTAGTGNRTTTAIDNYSLSWNIMPPPTHIELLAKTPADTGVALSTHQLTMHYDHAIEAGSGQIELYRVGNPAAMSFTIPSAAVTVSDSTAVISGISLENNSAYYVLMPEGAFRKQGDTLPNYAITDPGFWTFHTTDTTPPPPPPMISLLDETFTDCTDSVIGHFVPYNNEGSRTWHCSIYGHTDSTAAVMSGGIAPNLSDSSIDWLISDLAFDLSAMTKPVLAFWQRRRFEGAVTRALKISTDYRPGSNPDSANWTILQVQDMSHSPEADIWTQVKDIDLTDFKGVPFYLAFTYVCGTGGAYELSYDDILITDKPLGIPASTATNDMNLKVLGTAYTDKIVLGLDLAKAMELNLRLYDRTGRAVYRKNLRAKAGAQHITLENVNIVPGMYILQVWNERDHATVKVLVR